MADRKILFCLYVALLALAFQLAHGFPEPGIHKIKLDKKNSRGTFQKILFKGSKLTMKASCSSDSEDDTKPLIKIHWTIQASSCNEGLPQPHGTVYLGGHEGVYPCDAHVPIEVAVAEEHEIGNGTINLEVVKREVHNNQGPGLESQAQPVMDASRRNNNYQNMAYSALDSRTLKNTSKAVGAPSGPMVWKYDYAAKRWRLEKTDQTSQKVKMSSDSTKAPFRGVDGASTEKQRLSIVERNKFPQDVPVVPSLQKLTQDISTYHNQKNERQSISSINQPVIKTLGASAVAKFIQQRQVKGESDTGTVAFAEQPPGPMYSNNVPQAEVLPPLAPYSDTRMRDASTVNNYENTGINQVNMGTVLTDMKKQDIVEPSITQHVQAPTEIVPPKKTEAKGSSEKPSTAKQTTVAQTVAKQTTVPTAAKQTTVKQPAPKETKAKPEATAPVRRTKMTTPVTKPPIRRDAKDNPKSNPKQDPEEASAPSLSAMDHRVPVIAGGNHSGGSKEPFKTKQSGTYVVIIEAELVGKEAKDKTFHLEVLVGFKSKYGYLSASEWPLLPFYGVMSLLYLGYAIGWFIASCCNWRDLLRVQFWVCGVIALGMLENALFYSEYQNINNTGEEGAGLVIFGELVAAMKRTLARMLVIIVSMGFGIVKPRLGPALHKILGTGLLYFVLAATEGCLRTMNPKAEQSRQAMLAFIPLAVLDSIICWWIFSALVQTTRTLRIRKNVVKLTLYRHFTNVLVLGVVVSIAFLVYSIKTNKLNKCKDWSEIWLDDAFWPFLFSVILLVIMVLWRPTNNNQRYAFTPLIDMDEGDDQTLSDAFEGMKMRSVGKGEPNGNTRRSKAEDDLKWVEENIPSVPSTVLPTMDSDEELITTRFEISKME